MTRRRRGAARTTALTLFAATLFGCGPNRELVPVECVVTQSDGSLDGDTLDLHVHIDAPSGQRPPRLLVRVDPLSDRGAVTFGPGTPPTAAAASMALTTSAVFQGCAGITPAGFRFRAPEAPRGRVWLRVSSDVPVAVWLTTGDGSEADLAGPPQVEVAPGESAEAARGRRGSTP
ncbi:MAG: hypothetical protein WD995_01230 [Gemmatimonadota bacterium]